MDARLGGQAPLSSAMQRRMHDARTRYTHSILRLDTSDDPEVSIIIPVHNQCCYTHQCLRQIAEHPPACRFEIIVVDDLSTDETVLLPMFVNGVRIIRNTRNLGFIGAVMAGAAVARGRRLVLLNNDTEPLPGWLDTLMETMDRDPTIGIVGCKLLFPNGTLQEAGGIVWQLGDGMNFGRDMDPDRPEFCHMRDVDYVSAAAILVDRAAWDAVGGFDDIYAPGYYEDTDLCFKVRAAGWRVVVQPGARVVHHEGVTAGTDVSGQGMKRHQRSNRIVFARRWGAVLRAHAIGGTADPFREAERHVTRRVLFIDDSVPTPDQDAGSVAALEHMKSLIRQGFQVHFVPSDNMARIPPYTCALERLGIRCHYAPYEMSVEQVLRREAGRFDLVYIHRLSNTAYIPLARSLNPRARIVYCVADLHHLRLQREAVHTKDSRLCGEAAQSARDEFAAAGAAHSVITHSSHEAELLTRSVPAAAVHVIPWVVRVGPTPPAFEGRAGIAFIGGLHRPNVDAALWLVREIMPLVWTTAPWLKLYLVGRHTEDASVRALAGPRVGIRGQVSDLMAMLTEVRLTVAPLRFGAGLKGKVLDSLAAGLPCVMTPCAAEGADLPVALLETCAATAEELARLIVSLHEDAVRNQALSLEGQRMIADRYSEAAIDRQLAAAIGSATILRPGAFGGTSTADADAAKAHDPGPDANVRRRQ
jgi:GT2 family glycosyltransferase/glycosyltransferase involved in cell wall biosynthesis